MSQVGEKIEIHCKTHNCNRLLMNYFITGKNLELQLEGIELKCEKCKRVLRMKNCTEKSMIEQAKDGVLRI